MSVRMGKTNIIFSVSNFLTLMCRLQDYKMKINDQHLVHVLWKLPHLCLMHSGGVIPLNAQFLKQTIVL